ncbi:MAG: response regulator [Gallionella sp.]|jgi:signal transduction histidine kinase/DNA-binding response OmpR family regulator|nr:response regulator [Gallionella sp.]MCK9354022.1 response regulator [Gallionella sp.]
MSDRVAILLVDDRPGNLVALEAVLNGLKIDLVKAMSGDEALRLTLRQDFALVLLDVQMPGMSGFEMAELMRANPKTRHLPIIFVTAGMKDAQLQFKGYELGAVDYLIKPFEPHVLQSKVKVFCELYRQRRRLERTHQESLINAMREGFAHCKMLYEDRQPVDFVLTEVNTAFEQLSGLKNVEGRRVSEILPGIRESNPELFEIFGKVAATGNPELFETYVKPLDRWFSVSVYSTEKEHFVAVFQNITERKQAEDELRAAKAEAERANNAKSRFLAAASHDLRQPLSSLSLYVESLGAQLEPSDSRLLTNMKDCVANLSEMLSKLLDLSKLDAGVVTPHIGDFALETIFAKVASSHAPEANEKGLTLRFRATRLIGHTDPVLLQCIVGNLVSNAIRYTARGGVLLGCRRRQGKMWIEVWDTGIGIPADKTGEIFEEFKQLDNQERNQLKGSGLGLAIVAKKTALLGLQVQVRSRMGKGTVFAVELPVGQGAIETVANRRVARQPRRIALVEDNVHVRESLVFALECGGHHIVAASTGQELLALLDGHPPEILISDYRLAEQITGLDVILSVRAAFGSRLPAILITGDTAPAVMRKMLDHEVCVVHKPMQLETLEACIAELTNTGLAIMPSSA